MSMSQIYILISIAALAIIALVIFFLRKDKKGKRLTPLASLSLMFVLAGIIFSDNKLTGYGLIGVGLILALIDIILSLKKK